jgi:CheY-like chemotaxis protein
VGATAARLSDAQKGPFMPQILVVDDEPIIAMTIVDWLADLGCDALGPATDLVSALSLVEDAVDAVILDVSLGAQTTVSVARRLVERGVPFAVASGHDAATMDPVFANGILLPKPFGYETFRHVVERLLRQP